MLECFCDYDPPEWISTRHVKAARKLHVCDECHTQILPGHPYEYVHGKWDGYCSTFHTCTLCAELRQWALISVPCFCWAYGNLHSDVLDMVWETAPDVPGFYMEYGRRMVAIKRQKVRVAIPRK